MNSGLQWWGYLHNEGSVHAKRYFAPSDIKDAFESPYVEAFTGPFFAENRDQAILMIHARLDISAPEDITWNDVLRNMCDA